MKIQRHDPRPRRLSASNHTANSNFSPRTGRVICHVLRGYNLRANPYPTVAERGAEIERLMHLPKAVLDRMGLDRDDIVAHMLRDILPAKASGTC